MANALFTALAKAQAQFPTIVKNKKNYNKGEYADLTAILNAIKAPLLEHGIIVIQSPVTRYLDNSVFVVDIVTTIAHGESGETYEGVLSMPTKNDAQSIGSAITYGRRYALVSMLSLSADDDDDGEEATKPAQGNAPARQQPQRQAPPVTPVTTNGNGHKPTEAHADDVALISKVQLKALHAAGDDLYGAEWDWKRMSLVESITKGEFSSASDLTAAQADKLIQGMRDRIAKRNHDAEHSDEQSADNPFTETPEPVTA